MYLESLSGKELGKALLNVREYRPTRAEQAEPELIDLIIDLDRAITDADLSEFERNIIHVHYNVVGGDAIPGDFRNTQQQTADILGIPRRTLTYRLHRIWTRIAQAYEGGVE